MFGAFYHSGVMEGVEEEFFGCSKYFFAAACFSGVCLSHIVTSYATRGICNIAF
jgi:hypothetical protein